jgi:exodeoxyribonuclease VII large subunit
MFEDSEIYPVSNFVSLCGKVIKGNIPPVWVSGEVSNLSTPNSGHIYFTLKDNNAQISCAIFKFSVRNLKFQLENGTEIMVRGGVSLYEARGSFQLIVQKAQPVGVGSLELGFEQLKKKLQSEGLFDEKHKKPLVKIPKNIGVITSKTGAVIQDIIQVLGSRYPFAQIKIYDTQTQGEGSSISIINALNFADNDNNDTLIVARGGGSREDLWCFNDEDLAMAVFNAKTPIISSIGHEVDSTIIDFVADVYAPTPSAAAMLASPDRLEILQNLDNLTINLQKRTLLNLNTLQNKLSNLKQRLSKPNFDNYYFKVEDLEARLTNSFDRNINLKIAKLETLKTKILANNPSNLLLEKLKKNQDLHSRLFIINSQLSDKKSIVISFEKQLKSLIEHKLFLEKNKLSKNINALNHLNPLQVLDRGYSITSVKNRAISSKQSLKSGDEITTKFLDGEVKSIIK